MNFIVLDDMDIRHEAFAKAIYDRCKGDYSLKHTTNWNELKNVLADTPEAILYLDHDLGIGTPNGTWISKELIKHDYSIKLIIVHSANTIAADNMYNILKDKYRTIIRPFTNGIIIPREH
jgi:hypothetical protein